MLAAHSIASHALAGGSHSRKARGSWTKMHPRLAQAAKCRDANTAHASGRMYRVRGAENVTFLAWRLAKNRNFRRHHAPCPCRCGHGGGPACGAEVSKPGLEAQCQVALAGHANIVQLYGHYETEQFLWPVLEYCNRRFVWPALWRAQLGQHGSATMGVIHRDI